MKIKTAIAVAATLSITTLSCACSEYNGQAEISSTYSANLAESSPENATPDLSIKSETTPAASAPKITEPAKPIFDDPDSYIQINPENGTYILPEEEFCENYRAIIDIALENSDAGNLRLRDKPDT